MEHLETAVTPSSRAIITIYRNMYTYINNYISINTYGNVYFTDMYMYRRFNTTSVNCFVKICCCTDYLYF